MSRHLPPPTRYGAANAQPKAAVAGSPRYAPPPTTFGTVATVQAKGGAARPTHHQPPPSRFAPPPVQQKPVAVARSAPPPPPTAFGPKPLQAKAAAMWPQPAGPRVVQCDLVNNNGQWETDGRVSGHDSAANLRALSAKIRMRAKGAVNGADVVNNDHETDLYTNVPNPAAADFISGNLGSRRLAICHKMSSEQVQQTIATAANTGNWAAVDQMVRAITGGGWANMDHADYEDDFDDQVDINVDAARLLLTNLQNGTVAIDAANLTQLAKLIANSPANLFIGAQRINSSIQSRGDFNSTEITPTQPNAVNTLNKRRMTLDSEEIRKYLPQLPADMNYITHNDALNGPGRTTRSKLANKVDGMAQADTYMSSSTGKRVGFAYI
jgi:hypothetical protein